MLHPQTESILASALRNALRQVTLERALQASIVATIVTAVLAAGAVLAWLEPARELRWAALGTLVVLSLVYAWRRHGAPLPALALPAAAAAFLALAFASAAWSAFPALTAARATALTLLFVAGGALAYATSARPEAGRHLLDAVLVATVVVAAGGLVVLAFAHDRAVVAATTVSPARYQGLGGGPNTAMMVLSVGVPLAARALFAARTTVWRALWGTSFLLLLGSIVASGSRGALAAAFAGLFTFAVLASRRRRLRLLAASAVLALFVVAAAISRIPRPLAPGSANPPSAAFVPNPSEPRIEPRPGYADASSVVRLQDEVGHPGIGVADTRRRLRGLLGTSGRVEAWIGALGQIGERPVLGYGFGTEDRVFVDRYVNFNSGVPENSYVGLVLQLGAVGAAAFVALVALLLVRLGRALPHLSDRELALASACAGGVVGGLVLGASQSYIYAVGNNATAAVWLCACLLVAATNRSHSEIRG